MVFSFWLFKTMGKFTSYSLLAKSEVPVVYNCGMLSTYTKIGMIWRRLEQRPCTGMTYKHINL